MITIEPGVHLIGFTPQILFAILIAHEVYQSRGVDTLNVKSLTDSKHSRASLHYVGHAVDLRAYTIPKPLRHAVIADLKHCLGAEFDVVLEQDPLHIHIEWQPKQPNGQ